MWDNFLYWVTGFLFYGSWLSPVITFAIVWKYSTRSKIQKIILGLLMSVIVALAMVIVAFIIGFQVGYPH